MITTDGALLCQAARTRKVILYYFLRPELILIETGFLDQNNALFFRHIIVRYFEDNYTLIKNH